MIIKLQYCDIRTVVVSFIFERKVYRRILGPVYNKEKENRRILTNKRNLCIC